MLNRSLLQLSMRGDAIGRIRKCAARRFQKVCRRRFVSHPPRFECFRRNSRTTHEGPFGEVVRATGPMARANPFRFSTKFQDGETDMLYYPPGRFRNVSWGGWLSRDPIGEAGGINLYGFAANDPVSRIDPLGLWVISRFGAPRATATASEGDTIDSLAWILRLDKEDYQKWLRDMNGNRVTSDEVHPCWSFLVPNTVYVDKGMKQWRDIGPINIISVLDSVADAMAKKYRREGFHVVKSGGTLFGIKASEIMDHLNSDTIYEYWFFGHGGDGYINTAGFWGPGNEGVAPSRYTDYGIARMILFACESVMQISHTDPEGQGVNYVVTPWEANVSTRGEVLGFKVEVSGLDLLTKDPSEYLGRYRGTNNRP